MKSIVYITIFGLLLLTFNRCTESQQHKIETELQLYFNIFIEEASEHGMEISLDKLDIGGYIEHIEERGTLGQCKSYSNGSKEVVIDRQYWDRIDKLEREYLVFHELGHCILGREHLDSRDENGICTSIMQSGEGNCKSTYNWNNREQLLQELFEN